MSLTVMGRIGSIGGRECEHWFKAEAIWEQQKKQDNNLKSTKGEPKQDIRQGARVMAAKKKCSPDHKN